MSSGCVVAGNAKSVVDALSAELFLPSFPALISAGSRGGESVTFFEIVKEAREWLQSGGRIRYRSLKREFDLDDGIFALFGAPIAHEDHPQRALYAALQTPRPSSPLDSPTSRAIATQLVGAESIRGVPQPTQQLAKEAFGGAYIVK